MSNFSGENNNIVAEVKDATDIVDVISEVVNLKRTGNNFKGLCPFHGEKTPSFVVSQDKQIFTCFGCGATGDAIEFAKRYYNLEFTEAIEKLAKRAGIEYVPYKAQDNDRLKIYYEINRQAALYFFKNLTANKNPGYSYVMKRGISRETIVNFGLGFAENSWQGLCNYFKDKYDFKLLKEIGLVAEKNGRYYDKFRNRVMFPIIDLKGRVIGFGGRAIAGEEPKYLNSPESIIFKKKNNLYGLNLCKKDISKNNKALLVEGYMDVVSLAQVGIKIAVASLGTALTQEQASLLGRYTKNTILSYDSDEAGKKAALRGIEILQGAGAKPKVLRIKGAKDPDEFVKKNGKQAFEEMLEEAVPQIEYRIELTKSKFNIEDYEEKIEFIKEVTNVLKELTPVEADIYINKIASDINVSANAIKLEMRAMKGIDSQKLVRAKTNKNLAEKVVLATFEKTVLRLSMIGSQIYKELSDSGYNFKTEQASYLFNELGKYYETNKEFNYVEFRDKIYNEAVICTLFEDIWNNIMLGEEPEKVLEDCLKNIENEAIKARWDEIMVQISIAEENEDENSEHLDKLLKELTQLQAMGGLAHG